LRIFIKFLSNFCGIDKNKIKFWLLCYPDHNKKECEEWWSKNLNLPLEKFYKAQVIQGKHKSKRLPYGVGNITIGGKVLKIKVLRWIELMCEELTRV
jgi:hypothetical protein